MFRSLVYDQIREDTLYILLYAAVTMVCAGDVMSNLTLRCSESKATGKRELGSFYFTE